MTKTTLLNKINHAETMIKVYDGRDGIMVAHYENILSDLNEVLLDMYTEENEQWLKEQLVRIEA